MFVEGSARIGNEQMSERGTACYYGPYFRGNSKDFQLFPWSLLALLNCICLYFRVGTI